MIQFIAAVISLFILIYFIVKVGQISTNTSAQVDYLKKIYEKLYEDDIISHLQPTDGVSAEKKKKLVELRNELNVGRISEILYNHKRKEILNSLDVVKADETANERFESMFGKVK